MADMLTCDRTDSATLLPSQPYQAVAYHYGMLLGVDDFNADQASHRGKVRLHNAWLHGFGVVWGLGVSLDVARGELRVEAGLALDGAGRELHNDGPQCVSVGAWFAAHKDEAGLSPEKTDSGVRFDCQVVIRHRACLARPVPAMLDTCAGATSETAFSRVLEMVEILIRPGTTAPVPPRHGRLLRVLFGLEPPATDAAGAVPADDQAALDGSAEIAAAAPADRLAVAAAVHHRIAVLDSLAAKPGTEADEIEVGLYPEGAHEELVLASVTDMTLDGPGPDPAAPRWTLTGGDVDQNVRSVLVATSTLQDMLAAAGPGEAAAPAAVDAGPRVDAATVTRVGAVVTLKVDRKLLPESATAQAFNASAFDGGWTGVAIKNVVLGGGDREVTITLDSNPTGLLRLRALGSGASPLLGENNLPLFGATADRPATPTDALRGADFVWHG